MQVYAPQIKELQRKYKGNKQKLNEEMMKFYRENQVNPFASCLPLVFQLPVFFALYYVLRSFSREGQLDGTDPSFMWVIPNISERITEIGWGAAVVLGVYGLSQLISTELSAMPNQPAAQRRIFRFLPIVIISSFFLFPYYIPAGLVLYWATTNLWTAGQQLVMRHRIGLHLADPEVAAKASGKRSSRTPPKEQQAAGTDVEAAAPEAEEAPEPVEAPEPAEAPEAEVVGDDVEAEEAVPEEQGTPEEAPGAPEPARSGASRSRGGQGKRRQPRPKGGGGSRGGRKQPRRRR